jgi:hypothetical protein
MGGGTASGNAGGSPKPGGWRERRQARAGADANPSDSRTMPRPNPTRPESGLAAADNDPNTPPEPFGPGTGGPTVPSLPFEDTITKQVWGHLPERLRQQMTQYYREQFVSKYGDLLRDYYSALAEREKGAKK